VKSIFVVSLVIAPCLGISQPRFAYHQCNWAGFDLRASALNAAWQDYRQTKKFPFIGVSEANPLVAPFVTPGRVKNGSFVAFSVVAVSGIDWVIQQLPKEDRQFWYGFWFLAHTYTVWRNRRLGVGGFTLPIPASWTRPLERRTDAIPVSFVLDS
jgi:hypothetical protein